MHKSPSRMQSKAETERQLDSDMDLLKRERDQIMTAAKSSSSPFFRHLEAITVKRLRLATYHRNVQLANLFSCFNVQLQQAYNELERDKRLLRSRMLTSANDRRRRLHSLRISNISKKKKRVRSNSDKSSPSISVTPRFLINLERQGMLRVALTPDEVTEDLNQLLNAIDAPRQVSSTRHIDRVGDIIAKSDKIHSSKGTLHYYDMRFEKGDTVTVSSKAKSISETKWQFRCSGIIMSVNSKEMHVHVNEDGKLCVSHINHLCNIFVKPCNEQYVCFFFAFVYSLRQEAITEFWCTNCVQVSFRSSKQAT